jgi:hypothetical protein
MTNMSQRKPETPATCVLGNVEPLLADYCPYNEADFFEHVHAASYIRPQARHANLVRLPKRHSWFEIIVTAIALSALVLLTWFLA